MGFSDRVLVPRQAIRDYMLDEFGQSVDNTSGKSIRNLSSEELDNLVADLVKL